jgi:class 3 adenylate cyclase
MEKLEITVSSMDTVLQSVVAPLPLELGRQSADDSGLYLLQDLGSYFRVAIAPISSVSIPRQYLKMEWVNNGRVLIRNIHSRASFRVDELGTVVRPGEAIETASTSKLTLADGIGIAFRLSQAPEKSESKGSALGFRTLNIDFESESPNLKTDAKLGELISKNADERQGKVAVQLVRQSLDVLKKAAGSDEYFEAAVRAVAGMIELERAFIILYSQGSWKTRAVFSIESDTAETFSKSSAAVTLPSGSGLLLQQVLDMKRTMIYEPANYMFTAGSSMMAIDRAVAAPMLDEKGEVIGVIYGDRSFGSNHKDEPIGELEATLLEVMASAVASGLARQKEEMIRSSLTQFFSPAVTQRLEQDEDLLSGRDADVTVLFCDIRGFSGITERVGPKGTIEWINDVLTELSECVTATDGVLVDYIGDELMAMWGAPAVQADHAVRACRAALAMIERVEPLRRRHASITPDRFGIGIGINSGPARVGNTGSRTKFKYGPLGNTVNVASRIQGMTKKFGVPILMTESTQHLLDVPSDIGPAIPFRYRRIGDAQPLGVNEVVRVFQLDAGTAQGWQQLRERYESALTYFHANDLTNAVRELASLVHEHSNDAPSVLLLGRVVHALTNPDLQNNPVFVFDSK